MGGSPEGDPYIPHHTFNQQTCIIVLSGWKKVYPGDRTNFLIHIHKSSLFNVIIVYPLIEIINILTFTLVLIIL